MSFDVVVVGSINWDVTVVTSRHPQPGETVLGRSHYTGPGGKGANQAVAAARLGARVAMMGRVGDDDTGRALVARLEAEGIDTTGIGVDHEAPTGLALITVDEEAENAIVVSPGANSTLRPDHLSLDLLMEANVVLAQLEIPVDTVTAAARAATGILCLNPAPARRLPDALLERVSVLVPNRGELEALTGGSSEGGVDAVGRLAGRLQGPTAVVVTMGAEGALVVEGNEVRHLEAPRVDAVDTTGAGDAFCGALAAGLADGATPLEATRRAVVAGAIATTRPGAQEAMPTQEEVEALLRSAFPPPGP